MILLGKYKEPDGDVIEIRCMMHGERQKIYFVNESAPMGADDYDPDYKIQMVVRRILANDGKKRDLMTGLDVLFSTDDGFKGYEVID